MYASVNIAIYAIEIKNLEVSGDMIALQPGSSQSFHENDIIAKYEVEQSSDSLITELWMWMWMWLTMPHLMLLLKIKMLQSCCIFCRN